MSAISAAEQARRGHKVGVVCDAVASDRLTEARLRALEPHLALGLFRTRMSRELGISDVSAYFAIRRHALATGIDVIHGHGAKGGAYSRLVAGAMKRAGPASSPATRRTAAACITRPRA